MYIVIEDEHFSTQHTYTHTHTPTRRTPQTHTASDAHTCHRTSLIKRTPITIHEKKERNFFVFYSFKTIMFRKRTVILYNMMFRLVFKQCAAADSLCVCARTVQYVNFPEK